MPNDEPTKHFEAGGPYCGANSDETSDEIWGTTCADCLLGLKADASERLRQLSDDDDAGEVVTTTPATGTQPTDRFVCTKATPWNPSIQGNVMHPDAVDDGECADGCCDDFKCPTCGHRWRVQNGA